MGSPGVGTKGSLRWRVFGVRHSQFEVLAVLGVFPPGSRHDSMRRDHHHEVMVHFSHNDAGYLDWLAKHPEGFVINTYVKPSPGYLRLHHASCPSISRLQPGATTFTDGQYSKICGGRPELEEHARRLGGAAQPCPRCL